MAPRTALVLLAALLATGCCTYLVSGLLFERRALLESAGARLQRFAQGFFAHAFVPAWVHRARARYAQRRRSEALRACMPEAVRLIGTALSSGSSLVQALRYAAQHGSEPMSSEIRRAVYDIEAGQSFSAAMNGLRERTGGTEFSYLAACMELQHVSGGSLGTTIETVSEVLQQSARLAEDLRTKTAQGRLSARIVTVMPVGLLVILSLFTPGYLGQFFASPLGVALLMAAIVLEFAGIVLVKRAVNVDLSSGLSGGAT